MRRVACGRPASRSDRARAPRLLAVEVLGAVVLLPVLLLLVLALRRRVLQRSGGTIELSLRLSGAGPGQGWVNGLAYFASGGELWFYRVFSLSVRPRRVLLRRELEVLGRRVPTPQDARALHGDTVVLECRASGEPVELALETAAVTGFLAWLESRPPGATLPR